MKAPILQWAFKRETGVIKYHIGFLSRPFSRCQGNSSWTVKKKKKDPLRYLVLLFYEACSVHLLPVTHCERGLTAGQARGEQTLSGHQMLVHWWDLSLPYLIPMTAMHSITLTLIKWMPAGWSGCLCAIHTFTRLDRLGQPRSA